MSGYCMGHARNHLCRIHIGIDQTSTGHAPEVFAMSYHGHAVGAGETATARLGRVGWLHRYDWNAHQMAEQGYSLPKVSSCVSLPPDESRWVLNCNASSCRLRHGHNPTGFFGKQ